MSVSDLKARLHGVIDEIDNKIFLEALLTIASSQKTCEHGALNENEIRILEERNARYLAGEEKEISAEELKEKIHGKHGF